MGVQLIERGRGELCVVQDLLHEVVSEDTHLVFLFHDLFEVNNVRHVSDDEELVSATSYINVYLVERQVFLGCGSFFIVDVVSGSKFKCVTLFVAGQELPDGGGFVFV